MKSNIATASLHLIEGVEENWDADEGLPIDHCFSTPEGKFVKEIYQDESLFLKWLCLIISVKTLKCWEYICESKKPRELTEKLRSHLQNGSELPEESELDIKSPFNDCRVSETQSSADCVKNAILYAKTKKPIFAIYCISSADVAFDHVFIEDEFRVWLRTVGIEEADKKKREPEGGLNS